MIIKIKQAPIDAAHGVRSRFAPMVHIALMVTACAGCAERVHTETDACATERQPLLSAQTAQQPAPTGQISADTGSAPSMPTILADIAAWNRSGYSRGPDELAASPNIFDRLVACRIKAVNGVTRYLAASSNHLSAPDRRRTLAAASYAPVDEQMHDDDRLIRDLFESVGEPQRKIISGEVDALADVRPYTPGVDVAYVIRRTVIYAAPTPSSKRMTTADKRTRLTVLDASLDIHWYRVRWHGMAGYVASRDVTHSRPSATRHHAHSPKYAVPARVDEPAPEPTSPHPPADVNVPEPEPARPIAPPERAVPNIEPPA